MSAQQGTKASTRLAKHSLRPDLGWWSVCSQQKQNILKVFLYLKNTGQLGWAPGVSGHNSWVQESIGAMGKLVLE